MRRILASVIIIITLAIFNSYSQDSISHKHGISAGFDLFGPVSKIFQPSTTSYEASLNAGSFYRFFLVTEGGTLKIDEKKTEYNYTSNGSFMRVGFDYNFYKKNLPWEDNILFFGLRFGLSSLSQKANNIVVIDSIWGNFKKDLGETQAKAQWIEAVGGIRVEVIKNFSMGWSVRFKVLTATTGMDKVKPFVIPGFGSGASTTAFGFNYSLYYTFPLDKKKSYLSK
jgi:hypothetical protein